MPQLLGQRLVERHGAGLAAAIIRHLAQGDETGHTGDGDHMSMVLLDHAGQELLHHPEMRHRVDFERRADLGLRLLQNSSVVSDSRIVDNNRRITVVRADLLRDFFDVGGVADVGFVEGDVRGCTC